MADTPSSEVQPDPPDESAPATVEPPAEPAAPIRTAAQPMQDLGNLHRMLDVPLDMTVELGRTQMPLSEVLRLDTGSVVTIDRLPGEPIDLLINGRVFARGEVVVVNDTFGFRVTELADGGRTGPEPRPQGD